MTDRIVSYAKSGNLNIAYQITGQGNRDVVLIPGFVSHLEMDWAHPGHAHFLERLGSFCRLIRFDKRGTGLSDRPGGLPDLETRMDDVRAVMDASGCRRATLLGYSEGGPMAVLFAATFPKRTDGLILYGSYARRLKDKDYPWGKTPDEREAYAKRLEEDWGLEADMKVMCPTADDAMAVWWKERARAAASPGAARDLILMNSKVDVRDILPSVRVPSLILHRTGDRDSTVEEGRYIAEHIPGAKFIELSGDDHVLSVDPDQILDPIEEFMTGMVTPQIERTRLVTILFVDIVNSTSRAASLGDREWSKRLEQFVSGAKDELRRFGGSFIKSTGDGLLAIFDGPARAVHCARRMCERIGTLGEELRCGLHTAEVEILADDVAGIGVHIAARIVDIAQPGEVWVSRTVKDLIAGSGISLEDRGEYLLKGLDDSWKLFEAGTHD
jgi:class 3 adenylate cyclase